MRNKNAEINLCTLLSHFSFLFLCVLCRFKSLLAVIACAQSELRSNIEFFFNTEFLREVTEHTENFSLWSLCLLCLLCVKNTLFSLWLKTINQKVIINNS